MNFNLWLEIFLLYFNIDFIFLVILLYFICGLFENFNLDKIGVDVLFIVIVYGIYLFVFVLGFVLIVILIFLIFFVWIKFVV